MEEEGWFGYGKGRGGQTGGSSVMSTYCPLYPKALCVSTDGGGSSLDTDYPTLHTYT